MSRQDRQRWREVSPPNCQCLVPRPGRILPSMFRGNPRTICRYFSREQFRECAEQCFRLSAGTVSSGCAKQTEFVGNGQTDARSPKSIPKNRFIGANRSLQFRRKFADEVLIFSA